MNLGWLPRFVVQAVVVAALIVLASAGWLLWRGQLAFERCMNMAAAVGFALAGLGLAIAMRPRRPAVFAPGWLESTERPPRPPLLFSLAAGGAFIFLFWMLLRYVLHLE